MFSSCVPVSMSFLACYVCEFFSLTCACSEFYVMYYSFISDLSVELSQCSQLRLVTGIQILMLGSVSGKVISYEKKKLQKINRSVSKDLETLPIVSCIERSSTALWVFKRFVRCSLRWLLPSFTNTLAL